MSTKQLFVLTTVMLFLSGAGFGFTLAQTLNDGSLVPKTPREQALAQAVQKERQVPNSKAENFRVDANNAMRAYTMALIETSGNVAKGAPSNQVIAITDNRIHAMALNFNKVISRNQQAQMEELWKKQTLLVVAFAAAHTSTNPVDLQNATSAIQAGVPELAAFYASLTGNTQPRAYEHDLGQAMNSIRTAIDSSQKNDPVKFVNDMQAAVDALGRVSDQIIIALASLTT